MTFDFSVLWGGFYTHLKEDGNGYSIFRLLDFNKDAIHISFYNEEFTEKPSIEDVSSLRPFIQHTPFEMPSILNYKELTLIGPCPLDEDDLFGYRTYLEMHEAPDDYIEETFGNIMAFSMQPPMKVRSEETDGGIELSIPEN